MSKHTPGPWDMWKIAASEWNKEGYRIRGANGDLVVDTVIDYAPDDVTARVNACLITAAPELLEALKFIHDETNYCLGAEKPSTDTIWEGFKEIKERARAAIAKAEGRE